MANNIIPFPVQKPEEKPTGSGEAYCIGCQHVWQATAEVGEVELQCPECLTMKGRFRYAYHLPEGTLRLVCLCRNDLFIVTPTGNLCSNCGIFQGY